MHHSSHQLVTFECCYVSKPEEPCYQWVTVEDKDLVNLRSPEALKHQANAQGIGPVPLPPTPLTCSHPVRASIGPARSSRDSRHDSNPQARDLSLLLHTLSRGHEHTALQLAMETSLQETGHCRETLSCFCVPRGGNLTAGSLGKPFLETEMT